MKMLCRVFGHKFKAVIGSHEWAMTGTLFWLSRCYRCGCKNKGFVETGSTVWNEDKSKGAAPL